MPHANLPHHHTLIDNFPTHLILDFPQATYNLIKRRYKVAISNHAPAQ